VGTAAAVLLPRVWSVLTQWLVAAMAGTAALTDYLTTTTRGSAAVSLVANALAPVLILRRGAMRTPGGRALIVASLVVMALVAYLLTFAFEVLLGLGPDRGAFSAGFAAVTILGAPAVVAWPLWQSRDQFVPLMGVTVVVLLAATGFAIIGNAKIAAVVVGLGSAVPTLAMIGRARLSRALGYAFSVARRALPVSSMSFATALVYPLSLQLGTESFGAELVGQQLLFWPVVLALGIASQSIAARGITAAREVQDDEQGLRRWLVSALILSLVAAAAYGVFRWQLDTNGGESPLPLGMVFAAAAFIFSDPICIYFCPPAHWKTVAIGSVASALLVGGAVLLWPEFMVEHFSVCGPSGMVAALRLVFVKHRPLRGWSLSVLAVLAAGFGLSVGLR